MWSRIANKILRNRILILIGIGLITVFMGYRARTLELAYGLPRLLPDNDSTIIAYEEFRDRFGTESIVYVIGIDKNPLNDLQLFNAWYDLGKKLDAIKGVDTVVSIANNIFNIYKNPEEKKFELKPIVSSRLKTNEELDSIRNVINNLPFYKGRIYNDSTQASLLFITLNQKFFNSEDRGPLVEKIKNTIDEFSEEQDVQVHYSGLPFIRTILSIIIRSELGMFVLFTIAITILILFWFFRSLNPVAVSMLVVTIGVIWSLGVLALFGYKITILTSMIPTLIIVIGVPNCIYLINKYHSEYRLHRNQAKALVRVIQKVGIATLMTNATTAAGFGTFIFTHSEILKEFGLVASVNVMLIFINGLLIIPIIYSFLPPPKTKHTRHMEKKWKTTMVDWIIETVTYRRKIVYTLALLLVGAAIYGISKIEVTGNLADDLPKGHYVTKDLRFLEKNFNGVMPFEVTIDAKKPGFAGKDHTIKKIEKMQEIFAEYNQFSKPLSVVEGLKFTKQAFYNGNPEKYSLIDNQEKAFFKPYFDNAEGKKTWLNTFIDTTKQYTRISFYMADIGTKQMDALINEIKPKVDSIFNPDDYKVNFTGESIVFLKGTTYLVKNLYSSILFAILLIAIIMATMFSSYRMIIISVATNLFPLILTAGAMGFFHIPIKPSTILVFSIAFGISVDDTIHYLAKYRQELKIRNGHIRSSVVHTLRDMGISMFYTSIVLFFGFSVFASSEFGGTRALGILLSSTLLVAMIANLILLPSLLLTLDRIITNKAFRKEPLLVIYDEEEDIELENLEIKKAEPGNGVAAKNLD